MILSLIILFHKGIIIIIHFRGEGYSMRNMIPPGLGSGSSKGGKISRIDSGRDTFTTATTRS